MILEHHGQRESKDLRVNEAFETLETKKQRRYLLSRESFFSKSERRQAEEKRLESKQDGGWEVREGKRGGAEAEGWAREC